MSLGVELRGYGGEVVARLSVGLALDPQSLSSLDRSDFPYLSLVDEYAVTYFTARQMTGILPEIRQLRRLRPDLAETLTEIETLAELCSETPHQYLVIVGD